MVKIDDSVSILLNILVMVRSMSEISRNIWYNRIDFIYGDLKGQRSVNIKEINKIININETYDSKEIIIALETYFFLICYLISLSSLYENPSEFIKNLSLLDKNKKKSFLINLINGKVFNKFNIYGMEYPYYFDWLASDKNIKIQVSIVDELSKLHKLWFNDPFVRKCSDPLQIIHHSLFPKNLLHITGQFYSPEWLAELLIQDVRWTADKTLIDPFCGSGVFLIKAIEIGLTNNFPINEILKNIIGIDINPIACVSARANIVYNIGIKKLKFKKICINIFCADSIIPSIKKYKSDDLFYNNKLKIDNNYFSLPEIIDNKFEKNVVSELNNYGFDLTKWTSQKIVSIKSKCSITQKRKLEQLFLFFIKKADFVLTNPPWIGWEYISKEYRLAVEKIWLVYDLFKSKGLEAAFLKEDLSNLALLAAWDNYLINNGRSSVVLRPAAMQSNIASKGLRRLKINDSGIELKLEKIRLFSNINVFEEALTETATWQITKNKKTVFPITVIDWVKTINKWNPKSFDSLSDIKLKIKEQIKIANTSIRNDNQSRWYIINKKDADAFSVIQGKNSYIPRMGVFTGGANAVFYINVLDKMNNISLCENNTERAKIKVPNVKAKIENACIYNIIRGRDIQMWYSNVNSNILCLHNSDTKMYPYEEKYVKNNFPLAYNYLLLMKEVLQKRNGFANWEKEILKKYFYTLQRIGEYTFSRYKVCWKYISDSFTTCVLTSNDKSILPNDKVMFIPLESEEEAYYLCGILSSNIVRSYINSLISKRQISTNIIQSVYIPTFDRNNKQHKIISSLCSKGHEYIINNDLYSLKETRNKLDETVYQLYYM